MIAVFICFLLGITIGVPIGLLLSAIFERWAKRITDWMFDKFGWDK